MAVAVFGVADTAAAVLLGGLDFAAAVLVGAVVEIVAAAGIVAGVVVVAAVVVIGGGVDLQVDLGAGFGGGGGAEEGGAEEEQGSHDGSPERWRVETLGLLRAYILSLGAGWNDNCYVNYSGRARHFADGGIAIIAPISSKQLFVYTAFSFNFLFQVALCRTSPLSFAAN